MGEESTQQWVLPYIVARYGGGLNKKLRACGSLHIDTLRHGTATSRPDLGWCFSTLYTQPSQTQPSQLRNYGTLET